MTVAYIDTDPEFAHLLGRTIRNHDPRNRAFAALDNLPVGRTSPGLPWWTADVYHQQGSSCTAQAAVGLLRTYPHRSRFTGWPGYDTEAERHGLYLEAQRHDPWPGGEPDYEGSSTDAPFKVLRARGVLSGWRWLFGINDVREWLLRYGPACVGTRWDLGMMTPDAKGYIVPDGRSVGGHAYRLVQYSISRRAFRVVNSWSKSWGQFGRAWLRDEHLAALLADDGEAVTV